MRGAANKPRRPSEACCTARSETRATPLPIGCAPRASGRVEVVALKCRGVFMPDVAVTCPALRARQSLASLPIIVLAVVPLKQPGCPALPHMPPRVRRAAVDEARGEPCRALPAQLGAAAHQPGACARAVRKVILATISPSPAGPIAASAPRGCRRACNAAGRAARSAVHLRRLLNRGYARRDRPLGEPQAIKFIRRSAVLPR